MSGYDKRAVLCQTPLFGGLSSDILDRLVSYAHTKSFKAGATKGKVTARMTLDATGKVTNVEIVDAIPRRLFDRAVTRALADWRYAEGSSGRIVEVEIAFKQ